MSTVGKAIVAIAFIASLGVSFLSYQMVENRNAERQAKVEAQTELNDTTNKLKKTEEELKTTSGKLEDTTSQLTKANDKTRELQTNLTAAESKASELEKSLMSVKQQLTEAESKAEELTKNLDTKSSEAKEAMDKLAVLQGEKRILDDQLAAAKADIAHYQDVMKRKETGAMPKTISAKVTAINKGWNFVVLNVGHRDGAVENGIFMVYRGDKLLGKVKVVSAEENSAIADILPEWVKGEISVGDDVIN